MEDRILNATSGDEAALSEFFDGGDEIVRDYVMSGGDPSPGGLEGAELDGIIVRDWVASGSAEARFDRLATDAYWSGRDYDYSGTRYGYGGSVRSEAEVIDTLTVINDGSITFTFSLSGRLEGDVRQRPGTWPYGLSEYADLQIDFLAEFDKIGSSEDVRKWLRWERPNPTDTLVYLDLIDEEVSLSLDVADGDVIEFSAWAQTFIEVDGSRDVVRSILRGDFGSTAELTSVVFSDGVSVETASGFDYLSVNTAPGAPIPLPPTLWVMLSGLFTIGLASRISRAKHTETLPS